MDVIRPVLAETTDTPDIHHKEDVPDFVTRESVQPLSAPPQLELQEDEYVKSSMGWITIGFGVLYLIGAGLYFGLPLINQAPELLSIAGLILILALPLILLFLLWCSMRHLRKLNLQNAQFSKAANILVSPEHEAYNRSKSLTSAIQQEVSKLNSSLDNTSKALKDVQIAVNRETQSIDAAGLQLTNRSEDVGRNLTLQRQALDSISGTFDTRMETLSGHISSTSQALDAVCVEAETKLLRAGETMKSASNALDQTVSEGTQRLSDRISEIGEVSRKLDETSEALSEDLEESTKLLSQTDKNLASNTETLNTLNANTESQISTLHKILSDGNEMLAKLQDATDSRSEQVQHYYENLTSQLKQSEDDTLAAQGKTARMVESNLAQMRRDFSRMETDLQTLQARLRRIREESSEAIARSNEVEVKQARLNLRPLETDFPPVEPPRRVSGSKPASHPLNLGVDLEIETLDTEDPAPVIEPDLIRRPGGQSINRKGKGFGRRTDSDDKGGWKWRDMLGTLDKQGVDQGTAASSIVPNMSSQNIDGVGILTKLKLSPSTIVDEGTVVDATQAQINNGELALIASVRAKLPEAVEHLKAKMAETPSLANDLARFSQNFSNIIGSTPPTAPALRASLGSPEGRAYLLAIAALKG